MALEIVRSIVFQIAQCGVGAVWSELGYIIFYRTNVDNLSVQLQTLEAAKRTLQQRIDAAEQNGENIFVDVQNCLAKAGVIVANANDFLENEGHARVECLDANLWTMHQQSRKATEMAKEISEMITQVNEAMKMDNISYLPRLPVAISPFARGYKALDSRTSILSDIMHALKDPNICKIGLYGMGGVGKSTLVNEIAWKAEQDASFDKVVVAVVTISPDVNKIQGQLADGLGLKFQEETEDGRARRLRDRIGKENNILVILDDIWKKLELTEIGIPYGDDHKGCKLMLTSRYLNVLSCEMDTDKDFKLESLTEEESWILFQKTAGNVVEDYNIKPTALGVAHSCAGLPLSIVTVASALKKKNDISIWRDALKKLTTLDHEGLKSQVYPAIELSYNHLESEELKSFFLFIASLVNGATDSDLLIITWGLGLFKNVKTLADTRNRIYKLIADLRASCLLLEGERSYIKMHDAVHEVGSSIASKVQFFFRMPLYAELKEWPKKDILQKCHSIFLAACYVHELPESLDCPELKYLCLNIRGDFRKVPDDFFVGTRELQVLDLGGFNCCPSPPSSLDHLTNLRALYLCKSKLEDITIVAKLTNLEILNLESSDIKELPIELAQLTRLQLLDLRLCYRLTTIPVNLISSLTSLEELYMGDYSIQWEAEGRKTQSNNASLGELRHLDHLTTLDLHIQHASILPRDLTIFGKLERYNISIGYGWKRPSSRARSYESSRKLMLNSGTTPNIHLDRGVKLLLNRVEELYLAKLKGVRNVPYQLNGEGFPQLKLLDIQDSDEIQYIIDSTEWANSNTAFPNMESLILHNLTNMKNIIHGLLPIKFFTKLKVIKVKGCHRLENLFVHSIVRNLSQLVEVDISQCNSITDIIVDQGGDGINKTEELKFPKLSSLILYCLPMLVSFSCKSLPSGMKSRTYDIKYKDGSNIPLALFEEKVEFPYLETLKLFAINVQKIWDDKLSAGSCLQNLTTLTVDGCERLTYLFSYSVAGRLVKLQHLLISSCKLVENIFVPDENMGNLSLARKFVHHEEVPIFPNLETFVISDMNNLKSIWPNKLTQNSFCKLKKMEITSCGNLLNVFPCHMLNKLQSLESLDVWYCNALEVVYEIEGINTEGRSQEELDIPLRTLSLGHLPNLKHLWNKDPQGSVKFQNLFMVKATKCESLKHVFPLSVAKDLLQLQVIEISDCGVEEIIAKDQGGVEAALGLVFPKLASLKFLNLPKLQCFCAGNHNFRFPLLNKLYMVECPAMETFSQGILRASILRRIYLTEKGDQWHWEGDLNTTLRKIFNRDFYGKQSSIEISWLVPAVNCEGSPAAT